MHQYVLLLWLENNLSCVPAVTPLSIPLAAVSSAAVGPRAHGFEGLPHFSRVRAWSATVGSYGNSMPGVLSD